VAKRILAIGGSAFTGRVFSIVASRDSEVELHVVNRGSFPLNLDNVSQYKCDRHDTMRLARVLPSLKFDAIVDFCAYSPGEIRAVQRALDGRFGQYIFFSTASVYSPGDNGVKTEDSPVVSGLADGAVEEYLAGKVRLEEELYEEHLRSGVPYTILRPTFIYGPFNYAPRESYFIEMIARGHNVPIPSDATARFSFVYVVDVANATLRCVGDTRAYNETFNLAAPEHVTYGRLMSDFERCNGGPFLSHEVTVREVEEQNIPLPFPLTDDVLYNGEKIAKTFDFSYTPFAEGMEKTFKVFYSLYTS
jgi:nucleoside-diphosphate-sugar epimerase